MSAAGGLLAEKWLVITGATGGLGRAMAHVFAREGARLGLHGRRHDALAELATELEGAYPTSVRTLCFDVADGAATEAAVDRFARETGRIDGWVSNAALVRPGLLLTTSTEAIREQLEVNLLGPIHGARAVMPFFMRQRGGVLLHVSSVAAVQPVPGQSVYAATKGGVEALTRALAAEYAKKGVRVLCLRPGPIDTPMLAPTAALAGGAIADKTALRRVAKPHEVAETAAFLLSDRAAYATGSVIAIDGGWGLG